MSKTFKYELGDHLKDTVTGFKGMVTCRAEWYNGCIQYCLKPKMVVKEDNPQKMPEGEYVDEDQLEYIDKKMRKFAKKKKNPGGPQSDYPLGSCKP